MISGTDNEAYGPLIRNGDGQFTMGIDLGSIEFCPWCGVNKRKLHPTEQQLIGLTIAAKAVVDALDEHGEWDDLKGAIGELYGVLETQKKGS